MQRFNFFNQIHKGLRILLYDAASTLQQTDFSDTTQLVRALEKVDKVLYMFNIHGANEDEFILSLLKNIDPALHERFEEEHEIGETSARSLKSVMSYLNFTKDVDLRKKAGQNFCYTFNEFVAFNLYHMNKEELLINPLLWKHFTDDEIRAISKRIVEKLTPEENDFASYWMIKGLNNQELIEWLTTIKARAPENTFGGLMQIAEVELPAERAKVVQAALTKHL